MSTMPMSALKYELPRGPSFLSDLPLDTLGIIIEKCDEYTWGAVRGTCKALRLFTNRSMSEETAARRVFVNPKLYPSLREGLKSSVLVATNALTKLPSLLYHEATPLTVKTDLEMVKVALVSARVLGEGRLYRRIGEEHHEPSVIHVSQELESAMEKFDKIFIKNIDGDIVPKESELWRMPSFIVRYFQPRKDVNVELEAECFAYGGESIGNNKDVLKSILPQCLSSMRYCSDRLRTNPNFALELLSVTPTVFSLTSEEIRNDKSLVLKVIRNPKGIGADFLQFVGDSLQDDQEVVMTAIECQKEADRFEFHSPWTESVLRFASPRLIADREVMLAAVRRFGTALKCASLSKVVLSVHALEAGRLSDDIEIVRAAIIARNVENRGLGRKLSIEDIIKFEEFKEYSGTLLAYASDRLKDDEQVVFQAILNNIHEFKHASLRLKRNKIFCLRVLEQDADAIKYLDIVMRRDPDIQEAAVKCCCAVM